MPTVLCIDDDPTVLELQKNILEMNGYEVLTTPDGPTGVALARTTYLDAVVLDFKMPGMDGVQVGEVLMKEQPNLPVVLYTGFPFEVPEWLKWSADAFLHKGDGPQVLLAAIQEAIVSSQAGETRRRIDQSNDAA